MLIASLTSSYFSVFQTMVINHVITEGARDSRRWLNKLSLISRWYISFVWGVEKNGGLEFSLDVFITITEIFIGAFCPP